MAFIPPLIAAGIASVGSAATAVGATSLGAGLESSAIGISASGALGAIAPVVTPAVTAAASAPGWLSTVGEIGTGLNAVGGAVGAYGALKGSQAQAASAKYNSAVANMNAQQATRNAGISSESGSIEAQNASLKTRAEIGATVANEAASGLDVNTGSPVAVRSSETELGENDALTIRSNATKEAYGYQVQSQSQTAESTLDKAEAGSDLAAGYVNAGSTLLGSAGTAATNFAKYQLQGGFSA